MEKKYAVQHGTRDGKLLIDTLPISYEEAYEIYSNCLKIDGDELIMWNEFETDKEGNIVNYIGIEMER